MPALTFDILAKDTTTHARVGRVQTPHGAFDTPAFMPVGTRGTVKGILPELVAQTGAQILLNNTYHLLLRPGHELVRTMGGVHKFMNWNAPILTDSGGYQAYSLADTNTINDDGVTFKSVVDGSMIHLSPERAIEVQNALGADIIMAFDDCPPSIDPGVQPHHQPRLAQAVQRDTRSARKTYDHRERLRIANERTVRWLERCKSAHARPEEQALFGIVQGGVDLDERLWSIERICAIDLPGYAIGGVAVGESPEQIARVVQFAAPQMPEDKPRYLMGVGYEADLLTAVRAGVDMFDCVLPTRNGRNANAFTSTGQIRLRNAKYAADTSPIEPGCDCPACRLNEAGWSFSRSYLRHLFMVGEMLGPVLVSLHNLRHFQRFMADVRGAIPTSNWSGIEAKWPVAFRETASSLDE
ncbi:MAG: tRNA guanosine(34) transglycosylase Tgt [Phycisphaeraceae bacterium]|nr:tRNA guanosine(34) transglycosylase Tgt [Phycisphaerales bacterium]MCB9861367.1 tRNA guanosine(34) transglycosylase Tgt [Phycisphaeraceae bacterium]